MTVTLLRAPFLPDLFLPDLATLALLLLLISPAVGSFLALLVDRLPRGEAVIAPRSRCRSCQQPLHWYDLLPILSFALRRGRCRHCGAAIAPWFLYMELAALGLSLLALAYGGAPLAIGLSATILWLLLALAVGDLIWFRLPNLLNATLALVALIWAAALQVGQIAPPPHPLLPHNLAESLSGAGLGVGLLWGLRIAYQMLRRRAGLGLGDVKLMAGLGALVGPWLLPHLLLLAALLALTGAGVGALRKNRRLHPNRALPFGSALCAAGALIWLLARLAH